MAGRPDEGLTTLAAALSAFQASKDEEGEAGTEGNIANVLLQSGRYAEALPHVEKALALAHRLGGRAAFSLPWLYQAQGIALGGLGKGPEARAALARALSMRPDPATAASANFEMGRLLEREGKKEEASEHFLVAIEGVERVRAQQAGDASLRMGLMGNAVDYYESAIRLLVELGRGDKAFDVSERSRARALLDALGDQAATKTVLTEAERARNAVLEKEVSRIGAELTLAAAQDRGRMPPLRMELVAARKTLDDYRKQLAVLHPQLASSGATPIAFHDLVRFLPEDTALLEFFMGRESLFIFCVTRKAAPRGTPARASRADSEGQAADLELTVRVVDYYEHKTDRIHDDANAQVLTITWESPLATRVREFREACADPTRSYRKRALELFDELLGPVQTKLAPKTRVVIVADGALAELPFQALIRRDASGSEHFLAEDLEVAFAPSASFLSAILGRGAGRAKAPRALLAFANPSFGERSWMGGGLAGGAGGPLRPLPGTAREAEALRAVFKGRAGIYEGDKAQEGIAKREMPRHRYLHFATHGLLDQKSPMYSAIALASPARGSEDDGFLEAQEVARLRLSADLVVLSACETGRGGLSRGEGVLGLSWAFLFAGAPAVVASHWSVADEPTADLMKAFYSGLEKGQPRGEALRKATLLLLAKGRAGGVSLRGAKALLVAPAASGVEPLSAEDARSHPFYWAPFYLIGDWR